jgi:hypothetical protein
VHSFLDFNLHVPANTLLLVVVAGITYSIVFSRCDWSKEQHA